jgi:hypothetical protein
MNRPPRKVYPYSGRHEPTIFDLRLPGNAERLHRERVACQEDEDIEAFDRNHAVLIVRAGGLERSTR